ncbi:MAG: WG repeat-containing protein [Candidatus Omnitrophota bacterium]
MGIFDFFVKKKKFNPDGKVACKTCGNMILPITANLTDNRCRPCFNAVRRKPPFVGAFHDGLATIELDYSAPKGFVNKDNVIVIKPRFPRASNFSEGLACVCDPESYKYGYIDKKGNYIIKPQFKTAGDFHEGLAAFTLGGTESWCGQLWGFINQQGNVVIKPIYRFNSPDYTPYFSEGLAVVALDFHLGEAIPEIDMDVIDRWDLVYIDKKGDILIPGPFKKASAFKNGVAEVVIKGRNTTIRKDGSIQEQ